MANVDKKASYRSQVRHERTCACGPYLVGPVTCTRGCIRAGKVHVRKGVLAQEHQLAVQALAMRHREGWQGLGRLWRGAEGRRRVARGPVEGCCGVPAGMAAGCRGWRWRAQGGRGPESRGGRAVRRGYRDAMYRQTANDGVARPARYGD